MMKQTNIFSALMIMIMTGTIGFSGSAHAATPALVQSASKEIIKERKISRAAFTTPNTAGNLIVVYHVLDNTDGVTTTDTVGNNYQTCGVKTIFNNGANMAQIDYAANIKGGANTVQANYLTTIRKPGARFGRMFVHEFSGLDTVNPCLAATSAIGSDSLLKNTLSVTAKDQLLFVGSAFSEAGTVVNPGSGLTTATQGTNSLTAFQLTPRSGSFNVQVTANKPSNGIMQTVAFKQPDVVVPPVTANYFVSPTGSDSNPGTAERPFKTIQKAANVVKAGQTVSVAAGTYNEKIDTVNSGTPSARITFKAQPGAKIQTFKVVDNDYVTIDGFEMTDAKEGYMIWWSGKGGELLNNVIHDTGSGWGVVKANSTNFVARNNHYYSSTGPGDDLPVFILEGSGALIEDNEIGPAVDIDAFRVWGDNHTIRGNYIHDVTLSPKSGAHTDVIQTFFGGTSRNFLFEKNVIDNTKGDYFQMFMTEVNASAQNVATTDRDWTIRNNIYIGVSGQANFGIQNIKFTDNTLYNCGGSNRNILYLYEDKDDPKKSDYTGAVIKNNLIVTSSNITTYGQVIGVDSANTAVSISNNMITRLGTWGTVTGFTDKDGINGGNPQFVNAAVNDFHLLSNSPAINRGVVVPGVTDDFDGKPIVGAPDIGALEKQ